METRSMLSEEQEQQIELPPGFRFHPTDEELITHYLSPKMLDDGFRAQAMGEVDLNKWEPWELPWRAKMGEKEWYFFYLRDRKYPTGLRTNRATAAGYWKATGKDKEIHRRKTLVGMKKTLVFYKGRAPKGLRTDWVMHEYRIEGKQLSNKPPTKNEWVICRVFEKSASGKRPHVLGLSFLPPLMESDSPPTMEYRRSEPTTAASRLTCFSQSMDHLPKHEIESNLSSILESNTNLESLQISEDDDRSLLKMWVENYGLSNSSASLDCNDPFWKY